MKIGDMVEVSMTGMVTQIDRIGSATRFRITREGHMDTYVDECDIVKLEIEDAEIPRRGKVCH